MVIMSLTAPLTLRAGGRETGGKKGPCVYGDSLATQTQLAKVWLTESQQLLSSETRTIIVIIRNYLYLVDV